LGKKREQKENPFFPEGHHSPLCTKSERGKKFPFLPGGEKGASGKKPDAMKKTVLLIHERGRPMSCKKRKKKFRPKRGENSVFGGAKTNPEHSYRSQRRRGPRYALGTRKGSSRGVKISCLKGGDKRPSLSLT